LGTRSKSGTAEQNRPPGLIPIWSVADAIVLRNYVLLVTFKDGFQREVDVEDCLTGPIFEPLRDPLLFVQGRFDREAGTITWPNDADFAPEFLRWGPHLDEDCPCGH